MILTVIYQQMHQTFIPLRYKMNLLVGIGLFVGGLLLVGLGILLLAGIQKMWEGRDDRLR